MASARFLVATLLALAVLIVSLGAGIGTRFGTGTFPIVFHVLPIISAVAVTALPIVFFGPPRRAVAQRVRIAE